MTDVAFHSTYQREEFWKGSKIVQFGRWCDSFSSTLCSIPSQSMLFQPTTAQQDLFIRSMTTRSLYCIVNNLIFKAAKLEKEFIFQISTLNSHDINERFHSTHLFLFSCHHTPINGVAPFSACKYTQLTIPQFILKKG